MATETERIGRMEGILEEMRERMRNLEQGQTWFEDRFARLEAKIDTHFRWLVGITMTLWAVTVGALITFASIALTR